MKTWRSIGKACLKYAVLNIVMATLMLATSILQVVQPAMADTPSDIIKQFVNVSTNASAQDNGAVQPVDNNDDQTALENYTPPSASSNANSGEHVPVPGAQGNNQNNAVSPDDIKKVTSWVRPSQNASIEFEFEGKQVKLQIPSGAMNQEAQVEVSDYGAQGSIGDGMLSVFEMHAFPKASSSDLQSVNSSSEIKSFNKGLTFSIQHTPADLAGLDTDTLKLYYLDENTSQWMPVPAAHSSHRVRSFGPAPTSVGNSASGRRRLRPSASSTARCSGNSNPTRPWTPKAFI